MILITKETAEYVRSVVPGACIYKTMIRHGGKQGKYYAEETAKVLKAVEDFQGRFRVTEEYPVVSKQTKI